MSLASGLAAQAASPADPRPRSRALELRLPDGERVVFRDDPYSDRVRYDHVGDLRPRALGPALVERARQLGRGRVVALVPEPLSHGLLEQGYALEATLPGYYRGAIDCAVTRFAVDPGRGHLKQAAAVAAVRGLLGNPRVRPPRGPGLQTLRATGKDAEDVAGLIQRCFRYYPTPSGVTEYLRRQIDEGIPFRLIREEGRIVSCASADLQVHARTAELTDCATEPGFRGRGLMQAILEDLMEDLRGMKYSTAYTLCRASVPGVNLAFERLGFVWRGLMTRSCRIGEGIEDMNVWSRWL